MSGGKRIDLQADIVLDNNIVGIEVRSSDHLSRHNDADPGLDDGVFGNHGKSALRESKLIPVQGFRINRLLIMCGDEKLWKLITPGEN